MYVLCYCVLNVCDLFVILHEVTIKSWIDKETLNSGGLNNIEIMKNYGDLCWTKCILHPEIAMGQWGRQVVECTGLNEK